MATSPPYSGVTRVLPASKCGPSTHIQKAAWLEDSLRRIRNGTAGYGLSVSPAPALATAALTAVDNTVFKAMHDAGDTQNAGETLS
jgi:hypothetical protein